MSTVLADLPASKVDLNKSKAVNSCLALASPALAARSILLIFLYYCLIDYFFNF
jgi:hypothetical protein